MRRLVALVASAFVVGLSSAGSAQPSPADDSFMPVIVQRMDTISITTNSDPDIFPALRTSPAEHTPDNCTDLKDQHAAEAKAMAAHAKTVTRKGDPSKGSELQIKLAQDRTIRLFDYPCGESFTSYIFIDLLSQVGFAVVQQNLYEDYYFLAISLKTGRVSSLYDQPALSPDDKRFATYRYDQMNAVTELTLYTVKPDRIVREASCEVVIAEGDRVARPRWKSADTLSFVLYNSDAPFADGPTLKRQGNDWVLEGPVTFTLEGRQKKAFRQVCKKSS
jgi:hypothetical protein